MCLIQKTVCASIFFAIISCRQAGEPDGTANANAPGQPSVNGDVSNANLPGSAAPTPKQGVESSDLTLVAKINTAKSAQFIATSAQKKPLKYLIDKNPDHGSVNIPDSSKPDFVFTPVPGYVGLDKFTYIAIDADSTSAPSTVNISVNKDTVNSLGISGPTNALAASCIALTISRIGIYVDIQKELSVQPAYPKGVMSCKPGESLPNSLSFASGIETMTLDLALKDGGLNRLTIVDPAGKFTSGSIDVSVSPGPAVRLVGPILLNNSQTQTAILAHTCTGPFTIKAYDAYDNLTSKSVRISAYNQALFETSSCADLSSGGYVKDTLDNVTTFYAKATSGGSIFYVDALVGGTIIPGKWVETPFNITPVVLPAAEEVSSLSCNQGSTDGARIYFNAATATQFYYIAAMNGSMPPACNTSNYMNAGGLLTQMSKGTWKFNASFVGAGSSYLVRVCTYSQNQSPNMSAGSVLSLSYNGSVSCN